ncbi:MAG TPA: methyl-accepting chemotaxis protein [Burkholderiaceae bacterium]|jgi:aerotaxis receptor|nr:methyl-accepting chemotaxis protein [Burkholderiaceae bacterium]
MRKNLPVTQREYDYPDGETLVSTTDLKSRITYCNPSFIRVSGFSREELIGQPHNLIRHPDMPPEAFRDMWATIQSGQPWSALVKNRRKDGDHYWVVANVTPVVGDDGRPAGYMSVRTKPTRAQIQAAEALYARMRREAESGQVTVRLAGGVPIATGWRGALAKLTRLGLRARIGLALTALAAAVFGVERVGLTGGWLTAAEVALTLGGVALVYRWLVAGIVAPLQRAIETANAMAAGDLRRRLSTERSDEVGRLYRALSQLNVNLQAVVGDVRREVDGVQGAAREIAQGNQDLSARTEAQAASLQQTAASMEQLTSTVQQSASSAQQANQNATQASGVAERGGQAVHEVVGTMDEIQQAARKIADIIGVIDGIAFQTNILALNAAVEAARAGEQGRGFAVVAGEVRALAQRTSAAAREIKGLIDESGRRVERGAQVVRQAGDVMRDVVASVQRVTGLIAEISAASVQQSSGLAQINDAVTQLDRTTQQNAALVEQSASAAQSLRDQAHALAAAVQIFRVDGARAPLAA